MQVEILSGLTEKVKKVQSIISDSSPVLIAFSGGVDSALLLKIALDTVGNGNVLAATGISPSLPQSERHEAEELAKKLGAPFLLVETNEMENEEYRKNPVNRCFFCKKELFAKLKDIAREKNLKTILDGSNADDQKDWRPGMLAARQDEVRSPFLEADLTKEEIRSLSRRHSLPTWDKPAMPCLSSRIPYGETISTERLKRIEDAEKILRSMGFRETRVRDHYPTARIEIPKREMKFLIEEPLRSTVIRDLKNLGYAFVTLDLSGFQSGSFYQAEKQAKNS